MMEPENKEGEIKTDHENPRIFPWVILADRALLYSEITNLRLMRIARFFVIFCIRCKYTFAVIASFQFNNSLFLRRSD